MLWGHDIAFVNQFTRMEFFPLNKFQGKISKLLFNENKIYFFEGLHLIF